MDYAEDWSTRLQQLQTGCNNDMETFFELAAVLDNKLKFPLTAVWLGLPVVITAVNQTYSSHSHGLKFDAQDESDPLPIEEITFKNLDPNSKDWLDFYNFFRETT